MKTDKNRDWDRITEEQGKYTDTNTDKDMERTGIGLRQGMGGRRRGTLGNGRGQERSRSWTGTV